MYPKRAGAVVLLVALLLFGFSGQVAAKPNLPWGSEVNAGQCDKVAEGWPLVINVTHGVVNGVDSGVIAYWAFEDYNRTIQVWQIGSDQYCAVVRYQGAWATVAGPSPNGTDSSIAPGIEGTFEGGYRAVITGALNTSPGYRNRGNIGTFNHNCSLSPDHTVPTCTIFNWVGTYFNAYTFTYEWWGWIYHGGRNGTWVNSTDGNQGDITD